MRHRSVCHKYADAYQAKLTARKIPADVQSNLDECEKFLDVLNLVLIRQRIEVEVSNCFYCKEIKIVFKIFRILFCKEIKIEVCWESLSFVVMWFNAYALNLF